MLGTGGNLFETEAECEETCEEFALERPFVECKYSVGGDFDEVGFSHGELELSCISNEMGGIIFPESRPSPNRDNHPEHIVYNYNNYHLLSCYFKLV